MSYHGYGYGGRKSDHFWGRSPPLRTSYSNAKCDLAIIRIRGNGFGQAIVTFCGFSYAFLEGSFGLTIVSPNACSGTMQNRDTCTTFFNFSGNPWSPTTRSLRFLFGLTIVSPNAFPDRAHMHRGHPHLPLLPVKAYGPTDQTTGNH